MMVTGILLAGGHSGRMGKDKASLPWGDVDILHTELAKLAVICDELVVVSNVSRDIHIPSVRIVRDNHCDCGPLGGIEAGLTAAKHDVCFVTACDMPFLDVTSAAYLMEAITGVDAAVPRVDERWHPLYAAYRKTCLPVVRALLYSGRFRLSELLISVTVRAVTRDELTRFSPDLSMLRNLNTPEDWQLAVDKKQNLT